MTPRQFRAISAAETSDKDEQIDWLCVLASQLYHGASFAFQRRQIGEAAAAETEHVEPILSVAEMMQEDG